jgi:hypothetical protein
MTSSSDYPDPGHHYGMIPGPDSGTILEGLIGHLLRV